MYAKFTITAQFSRKMKLVQYGKVTLQAVNVENQYVTQCIKLALLMKKNLIRFKLFHAFKN